MKSGVWIGVAAVGAIGVVAAALLMLRKPALPVTPEEQQRAVNDVIRRVGNYAGASRQESICAQMRAITGPGVPLPGC